MSERIPPLKRIAAIHDLSGFGKCSLTVALPIVSATGVECACIPTALLSTHTGGFTNWTLRDLSEEILPIARHWHSVGVKFDGIYSGYLASPAQGELLAAAIDELRSEDTIVFVDPAMADNGSYYTNLDKRMTDCFAKLFAKADVVMPNITEACFLTGEEYRGGALEEGFVHKLLDRILAMGPKIAAITGVCSGDDQVGIAAKNAQTGESFRVMGQAHQGTFHGAGDVFASAFAALITRGAKLEDALKLAQELTAQSICRTELHGTPRHFGMDFEGALPDYIEKINRLF